MKKIFSWAGILAAAAMTLVGCAEEIDQPNVDFGAGVPFELTANTTDTKTVNDGLATKWAKDDALHVFYAEAGATEYGSNCPFTVSNTETGLFTGTLHTALDASKTYDWYILYTAGEPKYTKSPASKDSNGGYNYIGDSRGLYQEEYGSKAHLVGSACPMYAVVKGHAADQPLEVSMNHITSVIELNITNNTGASLKINSATITVPEVDIVGKYYFDITTSPITLTPNSTYEYAKVNVTSPADLADGESAKLYFVVRPFTINAGAKWSIQINDTKPVEKTLETSVTFNAGEIHTVNYSVSELSEPEPEPEPEITTVQDFLDADEGTVEYTLKGVITSVTNTQYGNFYLKDDTGEVYIYGLCSPEGANKYWATSGAKVGDTITIKTIRTSYNGTPRGENAKFVALTPFVSEASGVTLAGAFNGWNATATPFKTVWYSDDIVLAEGVVLAEGGFKVVDNGQWRGLAEGGKSIEADKYYVLDKNSDGQDISLVTYGTYDVYFDKSKYCVAFMTPGTDYSKATEGTPVVVVEGLDEHTWGIAGSFQEWKPENAVEMTVEGDFVVAKNVTLANGAEFKFVADNSWDVSYGSACEVNVGTTYVTYKGGGNMKFVGEAGAYNLYFSLVDASFYMEAYVESKTLTLTNAEICAVMTSTEQTYVNYTIESASGVWTVNASRYKNNTFLQCRGKNGAYIKTPEFDQDIKSITLHFSDEKSVYANNIYCVFPSTWTVPTTADTAYSEDGNVGRAVTDGTYSLTIPVNTGNKQVYISLIRTSAYYLDHIDVNF